MPWLEQVHMGTHMWTNASARRGRRMSFEMPPNFPPPPPSHFLHARPEMFHPYMNSAAMFQQKVSQSPISNICSKALVKSRRYRVLSNSNFLCSQFHEINALQKYSNLPHIRDFLQSQSLPAPSNGMVNLPPYQSYESALKWGNGKNMNWYENEKFLTNAHIFTWTWTETHIEVESDSEQSREERQTEIGPVNTNRCFSNFKRFYYFS